MVHIQDLVALTIGAAGQAAAIGQHCSLRAARLQAIKVDIAAHLREQEFTVGAVAAHQHVSARYVQMLFESEGTTFSHFVLRQRLALAKRMLADRREMARASVLSQWKPDLATSPTSITLSVGSMPHRHQKCEPRCTDNLGPNQSLRGSCERYSAIPKNVASTHVTACSLPRKSLMLACAAL